MRTDLRIVATVGHRPAIHAAGGLSARLTGPDTVHLISTAATPLGGDDVVVRIEVGAGARLTVRSAAATIALPGRHSTLSTGRWDLVVGSGATLDVDVEPMVVAADAQHRTATVVALDATGTLRLRERAQIGRAGESGGWWSGDLDVDLGAVPMLRHRLELGTDTVTDDMIDAPRAVATEFVYPDTRPVETFARFATRLPLAAGGTLTTWLDARLEHVPAVGSPWPTVAV